MSYAIVQDLIPNLPQDPYRNGAYEGICCHSTDDPNASATQESAYFHHNWQTREAFVHFIVGWDEIVQNAPVDYISWGCANGNPRFINIELCETADINLFKQSYDRYVWLIAKLLLDRKLGVTDGTTLVSHDWVTNNLGGTTHTDPIAYLLSHGITWANHVSNVQEEYLRQSAPPTPVAIGIVTVICGALNVRSGAGINYPVLKVIHQGESYKAFNYVNGWYNLGGNQWCSGNAAYVLFKKA